MSTDPEHLYWSVIFQPWQNEPVFHIISEDIHVERTQCGREIGMGTPYFPLKHSKKFGRPCKGCFPHQPEAVD